MRSPTRLSRPRRRAIMPWPEGERPPEQVAELAVYVGSAEHKGHRSPGFNPALRKDASECPPNLSLSMDGNTAALRRAIRGRCVGAQFENGFPKYVWGWIDGQVYEARHINGPFGTYKAYPLEPEEMVADPDGLLRALRAEGE